MPSTPDSDPRPSADAGGVGSRGAEPSAGGRGPSRAAGAAARTEEHRVKPARTSVAAALALALGVAAVACVVSVVLSPFALVLGLLAVGLGVLGVRMAQKAGVTGRLVALTGLVLGALAFLAAVATAIGITTPLNDAGAVSRLEQQVEELRADLS